MEAIKIDKLMECHRVWHRFSGWLTRTYGKDLFGKREFLTGTDASGKKFRIGYRSFNNLELSRRLVGYGVMTRVERYVKRYCPEIKVLRCDDDHYSGSDLLLIPHPKHGITVMFIPQCTSVQNQFFLYGHHHEDLVKALTDMANVYDDADLD